MARFGRRTALGPAQERFGHWLREYAERADPGDRRFYGQMRTSLPRRFYLSGLNGGGQGLDGRPFCLLEFAAFYKFDAEVALDFKNELQDVDGVNLQIAVQQELIVAQVRWGDVRDP
jgi:hypothetical protein